MHKNTDLLFCLDKPLKVPCSEVITNSFVKIKASKSESNRWLILSALYRRIRIKNISSSFDTEVLNKALNAKKEVVDVHHAGSAMRFLLAYYSFFSDREVTLTGSDRMKHRPISILVEALRYMGANIQYLEKEGYPPLKITPAIATRNDVTVDAGVSSQYISALFLIAPFLKKGLKIELSSQITSISYLNMTIRILEKIGVSIVKEKNTFFISPLSTNKQRKTFEVVVESDWSSASYYYSLIALSPINTQIYLSSYRSDSFQGDSVLPKIYDFFGVSTEFIGDFIRIKKERLHCNGVFQSCLMSTPDIAQTLAVTCLALGVPCNLTGLSTLKIKETDRLSALQNEMSKFGAISVITSDSFKLEYIPRVINKGVVVSTYNDHRMAMAFAPLCLISDVYFEDAMVVEKSYPEFWEDWFSVLRVL